MLHWGETLFRDNVTVNPLYCDTSQFLHQPAASRWINCCCESYSQLHRGPVLNTKACFKQTTEESRVTAWSQCVLQSCLWAPRDVWGSHWIDYSFENTYFWTLILHLWIDCPASVSFFFHRFRRWRVISTTAENHPGSVWRPESCVCVERPCVKSMCNYTVSVFSLIGKSKDFLSF